MNDNRVKIDYVKEPRFNGVDIDERKEYVRIHGTTYINKSVEKLNFKAHLNHAKIPKVPITDDDIKRIDESYAPITDKETKELEQHYGFKY